MLFIIFITFISVINCFSQDFRKSYWGDTMEQVISVEGKDYHNKSDEGFFYFRTMGGKNRALVYIFEDGFLISAGWVIDTSEFNSYVDILNKKFGDPKEFNLGYYVWEVNDKTLVRINTDFFKSAQIIYASYDAILKKVEKNNKEKEEGL